MGRKAVDEDLIIDDPELLSSTRRHAETGVTAFAAVLWLVALRPLLLAGLWYLGWQVTNTHMITLHGWDNPDFFRTLGMSAAGLTVLLFAWSRYNLLRFRGRERRHLVRVATDADMGEYFGLSPDQIESLRESPHVRMERPQRTVVVLTCADGQRFSGHHDPVGPPAAKKQARLAPIPAPGEQAVSEEGRAAVKPEARNAQG